MLDTEEQEVSGGSQEGLRREEDLGLFTTCDHKFAISSPISSSEPPGVMKASTFREPPFASHTMTSNLKNSLSFEWHGKRKKHGQIFSSNMPLYISP